MNKKIIVGFAVIGVGLLGVSAMSKNFKKDPAVAEIKAEFVGKVKPGQTFTKSMFSVQGVTNAGKLVELKDFSSKTGKAAKNGESCEVVIEAQGKKSTVIVDITRKPVFKKEIGYPEQDKAKVVCYDNGDLEFVGTGKIMNFTSKLPWTDYEYSHVYIDEALEIENMDYWFEDNENLIYCSDLPKTVKTIKGTFSGCESLKKTPEYFQCNDLKITDKAFSDCSALTEADVLPVNVSSAKYMFAGCTAMQEPVSLSKTSNLKDITGIFSGCTNIISTTSIPESVIYMPECYMDCINIKEATKFPDSVQDIASAYAGCKGMITGVTIPEDVKDMTDCYNGCQALSGNLEINSDTSAFDGVLVGATTNGDFLSISGNSGNLLAIQKDTENRNITLADPEAAARQNERMMMEKQR